MHLIKFQRILPPIPIKYLRANSTAPNQEFSEEPNYPPIIDISYKAKKVRKLESWSKQIEVLNTVEEKQMKLNMPRYYGWKTTVFDDNKINYNSKNLVQHCTRTHFKEETTLPAFYSNINVDAVFQDIKSELENAISFEYSALKRNQLQNTNMEENVKEDLISNSIIQHINRIILNNLSSLNHLSNVQIDYSPRHEAFWFVGGIYPPESCRKSREKLTWMKSMSEEPIDRAFQYVGTPHLAVRSELPLEPLIPYNEADNTDFDVPIFDYDPKVLGYTSTNRHGTNIPGFWPGDPYEFGLISYQRRGHILNRMPTFGEQDNQEALHCQGMLSSFAWLLSQASFQGFTTYNDLTYPLVAQTVITNGKHWSFYAYQLNTLLIHSEHYRTNPKKNICWGLTDQKLFEKIDDNGQITGLNEDVLKNILKFYVNAPKLRQGTDMKPYLGKNEKVIADISDDDKRTWLEKQYKHMMSNRPRHMQQYEIYQWEKIYKIDHSTRVMEPRRRPFELGVNPWKRRYDERAPSYIPKALRPDGPKSKDKFYKSYYP